jgi:hypothetical protein
MDDGTVYRFHADVIAENIFSHCDDEGRLHAVLKEISDHKKDRSALNVANGFNITKTGRRMPKTSSQGWQLLCHWRDGSCNWIDLKHVKDSNPIQLAEYAIPLSGGYQKRCEPVTGSLQRSRSGSERQAISTAFGSQILSGKPCK